MKDGQPGRRQSQVSGSNLPVTKELNSNQEEATVDDSQVMVAPGDSKTNQEMSIQDENQKAEELKIIGPSQSADNTGITPASMFDSNIPVTDSDRKMMQF